MSAWTKIQSIARDHHTAFQRAMQDPAQAQCNQLNSILELNKDTEFGRQYGFANIRDADEYRNRVPIHDYEDLRSAIDAMAEGHQRVLTSEEPVVFEETSGTSGRAKLVPYPRASFDAFQKALFVWLYDLAGAHSGIMNGPTYWSISPVTRNARSTNSGIPIGMSNDAAYFGSELAAEFLTLSAVPPEVAQMASIDEWRRQTVRYLLDAEDLALISIWSPTFLDPLLACLIECREQFVTEVAQGGGAFRPRPERARTIALAVGRDHVDTQTLWPNLGLISCWADAGASRFLGGLKTTFPHARVQGKGLLATEGVVSIPLSSFEFPVLALNSGFYEFLDDAGHSKLCQELAPGGTYRIIMTTPGGLYRYDTGDVVKMRGWAHRAPMLEFVGRAGLVSDLCGEKLTDSFVAGQLTLVPGFSMIAPSTRPNRHYRLFLDASIHEKAAAAEIAQRLEIGLSENPHYALARRLGQLDPIQADLVARPLDKYLAASQAGDTKIGDVKLPSLRTETDWQVRLGGDMR